MMTDKTSISETHKYERSTRISTSRADVTKIVGVMDTIIKEQESTRSTTVRTSTDFRFWPPDGTTNMVLKLKIGPTHGSRKPCIVRSNTSRVMMVTWRPRCRWTDRHAHDWLTSLVGCKMFSKFSGGSRIFPGGGGRQLPKLLLFFTFLPKTAWKWKNLDPQGGRASLAPPLGSANEIIFWGKPLW